MPNLLENESKKFRSKTRLDQTRWSWRQFLLQLICIHLSNKDDEYIYMSLQFERPHQFRPLSYNNDNQSPTTFCLVVRARQISVDNRQPVDDLLSDSSFIHKKGFWCCTVNLSPTSLLWQPIANWSAITDEYLPTSDSHTKKWSLTDYRCWEDRSNWRSSYMYTILNYSSPLSSSTTISRPKKTSDNHLKREKRIVGGRWVCG